MSRKALRKDFYMEIRKSLGRFLSIFAIVAIGVAFFSGIRSTFYRLATIFGQGILEMIAGNLQLIFRNNIQYSWSLLFYGVMGLFLVLWLWHSYVLPHPKEDQKSYGGVSEMWKGFKDKCITFSTKFPVKNVIVSLFFMLLFCFPAGLLIKVDSVQAGMV